MRWAVVFVLVGCSYKPPGSPNAPSDGEVGDDAPGIDVDASGQTCLGSGNFEVCVPTPTMPFAVSGGTNTGIDTDAAPPECIFYPQPGNRPTLCVIAATTITIDANILGIIGNHPAVLFATETIEIGRAVNVGSHQNGQAHGAGADSASCDPSSNATSNMAGGGGGAGGSFGTKGGNGGAGGSGAGAGGSAGAITAADFLRGGCLGSDGGNGIGGATHGGGNLGGGAVLLLAGTSITISGFVNASGGGGGRGTATNGGGGGGGSGGMIAMSAPAITVTGKLLANGGGGGGGASNTVAGGNGFDADPDDPTNTANGGSGGAGGGGNGASGAAGSTTAGNTGQSSDGAGGAGGGLGVIRILSGQTIGGTSSPVPLTQ